MTDEKPRDRLAVLGLLILIATFLPWTQAVSVERGATPVEANSNDTIKLAVAAVGFLIAL